MFRNLALNRVFIYGFGLALLFASLNTLFGTRNFIFILNGVLAGCGVAIAVTFWPLFWQAVRNVKPYGDVRQMAVSIMVMWAAIGLDVYTSVSLYSTGTPVNVLITVAVKRFMFIVAASLQVFVPDYGLGFFYGTERRTFWLAGSLGAFVMAFTIYFQATEAFAL